MGTVRYTVIDGEVVSELRSGVKRDYLPDPLGSTVALLDSSQAKTDTFEYWPYGESAARTGTTATPFQYVGTMGYYNDSASKNYIRARYLDKAKGRWITEDRHNRLINDRYSYCRLNPLKYVDVSGDLHVLVIGGIIMTIGLAKVMLCAAKAWELGNDPGKFPTNPGVHTDKKQHCFICCSIVTCLGNKFGPGPAFIGQVLWELLQITQGHGSSPISDTKACVKGIGIGSILNLTPISIVPFGLENDQYCKQACSNPLCGILNDFIHNEGLF